MLYQDEDGNIVYPDEVEAMSGWEIEEYGIHKYHEDYMGG